MQDVINPCKLFFLSNFLRYIVCGILLSLLTLCTTLYFTRSFHINSMEVKIFQNIFISFRCVSFPLPSSSFWLSITYCLCNYKVTHFNMNFVLKEEPSSLLSTLSPAVS